MRPLPSAGAASFRLTPRGPYSLASSAAFLCGFTPAAGASATLDDGRLVLGFLDETRHAPVAVALSQRTVDGAVVGELAAPARGADSAAIAKQIMRVLSLDHDARGLLAATAGDAVARELVTARPGFRPVCFPSPYEAAIWGVLAQRVAMPLAASLKQRLAIATGAVAEGFGRTFHPSPAPRALLALEAFPGLPAEKLARLHAVALAALDGRLDAERLRALPRERALEDLRAIRGVGPWTAEHVLVRGCGSVDELPAAEPRVLRAIAEAYGLEREPTAAEALRIAERWRPYRTWITVLLVMNLRPTPRWRKFDRAS